MYTYKCTYVQILTCAYKHTYNIPVIAVSTPAPTAPSKSSATLTLISFKSAEVISSPLVSKVTPPSPTEQIEEKIQYQISCVIKEEAQLGIK
jgi:hypothetical protein